VRADRRDDLVPLSVSHGYRQPRPGRSAFRTLFDWTGTDDPTPFLVLPELIAFLSSILPGALRGLRLRNHALVVWARDRVCGALELEPPAPESMLGSMATVRLPPSQDTTKRTVFDPDPLQVALFDRFHIEVPVFPWPRPGERCLRISAQAYNCASDYERLVDALLTLQKENSQGGREIGSW
jgi:isopenicillin-N epimerase